MAAIAVPSISGTALLGGIPMLLAAIAVAIWGIETHRRRLEDITADEVGVKLPG
ncbi:MAG: hypothetical protein LC722_08475 [Actinobacteria bacterium]|nr:hypothetical protein [Actinomycetota bacterium]